MLRTTAQLGMRLACLFGVCLMAWCAPAWCQASADDNSTSQAVASAAESHLLQSNPAKSKQESSDSLTVFPHSETSRYWISGQANFVFQWHPSFPAKYSGPNSLRAGAEHATTRILTLYLGYELTPTTEVYLDMESSGGNGISNTLGLAGYTDLDAVRVGLPNQTPYVARAMIRQVIPLTHKRIPQERDATSFTLANTVAARRIEIRAGKFSLADFFDTNTYGSDSHLQFLNWTVDNDGAYDYAANTRGYTDGAIVEYDDHWFSARFGEALMPKVANGIHLDADLARARSENVEFDFAGNAIGRRPGAVRLLAYVNHADMGNYEQAIGEYLHGQTAVPDIVATRRQGRHKYGFALNFEQEIASNAAIFGRLGWSDGRNESFAYTECDRALELGAFTKGTKWDRGNDRAGVAFVANGIVAAHREYLALGGLGFQLGDGGLTYGPEKIAEAFYTVHLWRGFFGAFDLQHVNNPGYNMARGPVVVPALRFHVDF
ncbi:MAG TPA: carbohydrate porin [Candidatus Acidoferrales bacterium]|nr:carbohydrate porin [Candidatus Acidoferrales bacterium]